VTFELRNDGDGVRALGGDLDLAAVEHLERTFPASASVATIDLGVVAFIDSSGLNGLVQIRRQHPRCRYVNVPSRVRRLFELTGLAAVILD
jgi:anti-anti-sigma factor